MKKNWFTDGIGLRLSRQALRVLRQRGIFAQSSVRLQHQQLGNRYVVRGVESGGAAGDVGRYVTFAQVDGQPIECLCPVEAIGVNGPHSIVVAPVFLRVDMLRKGHTYELLITRHAAGTTANGCRPPLETTVLFRGVHGRLALDLSAKDKMQAGAVSPTFYSLSGEEIAIPEQFTLAVRASVKATNCIGCCHSHYVCEPRKKEDEAPTSVDFKTPALLEPVVLAQGAGSREVRTNDEVRGRTARVADRVRGGEEVQ